MYSAKLPTSTPSKSSKGGETDTTIHSSFTASMDYDAAPKEKSNTQTERIIEIEAIVDGQTVLTNTNKYAASAVAKGTNKELSDIKAMLKQLADYVTAQATTVETLSIMMNGVSSGAGKTIEKKKARQGLHLCPTLART